ncbi:hypothetical protein NXS19_001767 [Fusarium pseudograminearum]|nr:hypothetical protein NXS19_001767 [Fusarium pseudograminearum]
MLNPIQDKTPVVQCGMHISLGPLIVWYCLTARFCLTIQSTVPSPCLPVSEPTKYKALWCLMAVPLHWGPGTSAVCHYQLWLYLESSFPKSAEGFSSMGELPPLPHAL